MPLIVNVNKIAENVFGQIATFWEIIKKTYTLYESQLV